MKTVGEIKYLKIIWKNPETGKILKKRNIIEYISAMIMIMIFEIKDLKVIRKKSGKIRKPVKFWKKNIICNDYDNNF